MLLVGLGNPGKEYEGTRHNIGFRVLDSILAHYEFPASREKFSGLFATGEIDGEKIYALKPLTYMNHSGTAVQQAAAFYKIPPEKIIVFHDEIDLVLGKVRVKVGGGHAGHNGLKDIDAHIGKNYKRVRIGVGHPGEKKEVRDYVLHPFSKEDKKIMKRIVVAITESLPFLLQGEDEKFMTKIAFLVKGVEENTPLPGGERGI